MKCEFLGWDKPILQKAVDKLFERRLHNLWDLTDVLLVLPSSLAGRRLGELLAERAAENKLIFYPPEIVTVGSLPEKLYQAKFPFASDSVQVLTWVKALQEMSADELRPLLFDVPSQEDLQAWIDLARMLATLHRELATDLKLCCDVADVLAGQPEEARWRVLYQIQRKYLDRLHVSNLWDIQTARRYAIEKSEAHTDSEIIVLGAVDLNAAQRKFLDAVAENVTILVGAPSSWSDGFDRYGTLIPDFWESLRITIDSDQIAVRGTASDAAEEVVRQLAELEDTRSTREVTLGVPDPSLIPVISETIGRFQVKARYGPGQPVEQSAPVAMLHAISEYLRFGTFQSFGTLIRVPSVSRYLRSFKQLPGDYLEQIDAYYNDTLLGSVNAAVWPDSKHRDAAYQSVQHIDEWLQPLRFPKQSLRNWGQSLLEVMQTVLDSIKIDLEDEDDALLWGACSHLNDSIFQLSEIPSDVDVEVTIDDAIAWMIRQVAQQRTPPLLDSDAVEMLGWLELALDDAPTLILTGLHDGFVPESVNSDSFLPNGLRAQLGLMDNSRRYARDCYVFQTILHVREHVRVVLNHLGIEGDPQTPSRLLLAVHQDEIAERVEHLLHPIGNHHLAKLESRKAFQELQTQIPIPLPRNDEPITSLAVTDFKSYLNCPYRFYLARIRKLQTVDDKLFELAANHFGSLIHECLMPLKDSNVATSTDAEAVRGWLFARLEELAKERFGVNPLPSVRIQIEQARQRLAAFAVAQAEWAGQGWEIRHAEVSVRRGAFQLVVDDEPMGIHGQIDRIDYNPTTRQWAVLDYKTGEGAEDPTRAHFGKQVGWKDLQLPLYQLLVSNLGIHGDVLLGYISLPKSTSNVDFRFAKFTTENLADARLRAEDIIRDIRAGKFWPPRERGIPAWDPFHNICQNEVARKYEPTLDRNGTPQPMEFEMQGSAQMGFSFHSLNSDELFTENKATRLRTKSTPRNAAQVETESISGSKTANLRSNTPEPERISTKKFLAQGTPPLEWFDPLAIRASAGTGKTYQLAIRLLRLLFSEEAPDTVLATTFTRKAAGEILERVLSRLARAILSPSEFEKLAQDLKPLEIDVNVCKYQLARLCENLHRFRVSTLDSFYSQLARSCALELELPPAWKLVDPYRESLMRDQAIRRMFETQDMSRLRALLAMLFKGETTRSLTSQIRQLVDDGYALFTVTDRNAWTKLTPPPAPEPELFHAAYQTIERFSISAEVRGRTKSALEKTLDSAYRKNWDEILKSTICQNAHDEPPKYDRAVLAPELAESLRILVQKSAHEEIQLRAKQLEATYDLLAAYAIELEHVKRRNRAVSFSDLAQRLSQWMLQAESNTRVVAESKNLLTSGKQASDSQKAASTKRTAVGERGEKARPDLSQIGWRMDCSVQHLLLDEFQDTSPVQWNVIKPFAEAIAREGIQRGKSFFCVGDTKQAIYGWRGGVAEIFDAVGDQLTVKESKLLQSRRSSRTIMEFVNEVFQNLNLHSEFGAGAGVIPSWTTNFPMHETVLGTAGYVQLKNGGQQSKTFESQETGGEDDAADALLEIAAEDVAELATRAPNVSIGVLVRSNDDVATMIHLLRERGVDPSQEGGNPLTDSAAVELLLSLIHVADHPGDSRCAFHIENSPLVSVLALAPMHQTGALGEEVRKLISRRGYGKTLATFAERLSPYCTRRDQQRLDQLVTQGHIYDANPTLRVRDFVDFIRQEKIQLPKPAQVRVMTTHQSKGLEFDAVFLPDLNKLITRGRQELVPQFDSIISHPIGVIRNISKDLLPHLDPTWQDVIRENAERKLVEELCVFYVALTRARKALYLYAFPQKKSPTQRWGSVLHSILCGTAEQAAESDCVIYRDGDEHWMDGEGSQKNPPTTIPSPSEHQDRKDSNGKLVRTIDLTSGESGQFTRFRRAKRPSSASEATLVRLSQAMQKSSSTAAIIGTIVHRWFEEIEWLEDFDYNPNLIREIALQTLSPEETAQISLDACQKDFEGYLPLTCIQNSLAYARYRPWLEAGIDEVSVSNERRILELRNNELVRGTIDRLVLGYSNDRVVRAEVLDYKTDRYDPKLSPHEWEQERIAHHRHQLELYRDVLSQQYDIPKHHIDLQLILLNQNRIATIDAPTPLFSNLQDDQIEN